MLDLGSIIPGGGDVADIARLGAGSVSLTISIAKHDSAGVGLGAGGVGTAVADGATRGAVATSTLVKDGLEAIPIVGSVVGVGALLYDGYSAVKDYKACMSGG